MTSFSFGLHASPSAAAAGSAFIVERVNSPTMYTVAIEKLLDQPLSEPDVFKFKQGQQHGDQVKHRVQCSHVNMTKCSIRPVRIEPTASATPFTLQNLQVESMMQFVWGRLGPIRYFTTSQQPPWRSAEKWALND